MSIWKLLKHKDDNVILGSLTQQAQNLVVCEQQRTLRARTKSSGLDGSHSSRRLETTEPMQIEIHWDKL